MSASFLSFDVFSSAISSAVGGIDYCGARVGLRVDGHLQACDMPAPVPPGKNDVGRHRKGNEALEVRHPTVGVMGVPKP